MRPGKRGDEADLRRICIRAGLPALAAWCVVPLAFLIPAVDSTRAPYFDLTSSFSQLIFWITQTGGKVGILFVALLMLVMVVTRAGVAPQRRWRETGIIFVTALTLGGGSAVLNEYFLKEQLQVPRPNVVRLAGEGGTGALGMTPQEFYSSKSREARSNLLTTALENKPDAISLSPQIEYHWVHQTGYSFPSGHAFSSMFFAVFFLMLASTFLTTKRRVLFYTLLPWTVAVCYSRSILGVHSPADIAVGSGIGLALGVCAWVVTRFLIRRYA